MYHYSGDWFATRYFWNNKLPQRAEDLHGSDVRPDMSSASTTSYHYDTAGLTKIDVLVNRPSSIPRKLILWLRPDLRPNPDEARAALFDVLLPAIQRAVADAAGGQPVRRVALVCSDEGTHDGGMPPTVFVGCGDVGSGPANHWPFADLGIARNLGGPGIDEACKTFNLTDWKNPGRLSGRATAELARRLTAAGLCDGAMPAPDLVCFATTPEGKPLW